MGSVLALLSADVRQGDECDIEVTGDDEATACAAVQAFFERELEALEQESEKSPASPDPIDLPIGLASAAVNAYRGIRIYPGCASGRVVVLEHPREVELPEHSRSQGIARETDALRLAGQKVRTELERAAEIAVAPAESAILRAQVSMLEDPALIARALELVTAGSSASTAITTAAQFFGEQLRRSQSAYVRERAADVMDVCDRLREALGTHSVSRALPQLESPSIVVASSISPRELLGLRRDCLKGLVLESATTTSHAAILARSFGIPTVASVTDATLLLASATSVVVDANRGLVMVEDATTRCFYEREARLLARREQRLAERARRRAATLDRVEVTVAANVMAADEAQRAMTLGADGIGLFRTELLFTARARLLSEEEQFEEYAAAARPDRLLVIRTLDVGGDKPLPELASVSEPNPFLGLRGVRLYPHHLELFETQLRAILRASAHGRVALLIPMVSAVEEVSWVNARLASVKAQLADAGLPFDSQLPVGVMLEVPAACLIVEQLAAHVQFFSLGTNDLAQYFAAADRTNASVSALASPLHPGFLQFLQQCIDRVHACGKHVAVCGEMAAEEACLPLLLGLDVDELSVSSAEIPALKERIRKLSAEGCRDLVTRAMRCDSDRDVRALIDNRAPPPPDGQIIEPDLVWIDAPVDSRTDALRALADLLFITGRAQDPDAVEQALWAREATYSTNLGTGIAVPHCKSDAVDAESIAVLRLPQGIRWDDGVAEPVDLVIMLASRETGAEQRHLRRFALLARKLIDPDFRERLRAARDAADVTLQLQRALDGP
jgi:fructose-specific PTS system IIA-like component